MCDHRVDISRRNEKGKSRATEALEILAALIIGLCEDGNAKAVRLQYSGNYRHAKGRVIDVRITRDKYEIYL